MITFIIMILIFQSQDFELHICDIPIHKKCSLANYRYTLKYEAKRSKSKTIIKSLQEEDDELYFCTDLKSISRCIENWNLSDNTTYYITISFGSNDEENYIKISSSLVRLCQV